MVWNTPGKGGDSPDNRPNPWPPRRPNRGGGGLDGLMERNAGEWQGLTRDQIDDAYPGYLDSGRRPPGWEPDDEVQARVLGAFDAIALQHQYGTAVAVAHAGVIFAAEAALGAPWEKLANLGGRWLVQTDGEWRLGDRVHLLIEETIPDQI